MDRVTARVAPSTPRGEPEYRNRRKAMFTNLRQTLGVALAALFLAGLAGCNTMEGMGEDVESAGEAIEEEAEEAQ